MLSASLNKTFPSFHCSEVKVEKPVTVTAGHRVSDGVERDKLDMLCEELRTADNDPGT